MLLTASASCNCCHGNKKYLSPLSLSRLPSLFLLTRFEQWSICLKFVDILLQWQWLLIDITDLMSNLLSRSYQSLESLSVCGSCRIRSIATLRDIVASPADLPSSWQPPPSAPSLDINVSVCHMYVYVCVYYFFFYL